MFGEDVGAEGAHLNVTCQGCPEHYSARVHSLRLAYEAMTYSSQATITQLLDQLRSGSSIVLNELFARTYETLHVLAHQQRQHWHSDYTANTTALVHEAYLKLANYTHFDWNNRAHFFAVAATIMRHILIDYAKRRRAEKRGGDKQMLSLDEAKVERPFPFSDEQAEVLVVLDEALDRLRRLNERQSLVVEYRFFGAMSIEETSEALEVSVPTVNRDWAMARAWLYREIQQAMQSSD